MRNNNQISNQTKQIINGKSHDEDAFSADANFFYRTEEVKPAVQNGGTNYLCTQDEFWKKQLYNKSAN